MRELSRAWVALIVVSIGLLALLVRPAFTPPIAGAQSVATLREETLNGHPQWVLTRGAHRERPLLLFLHGGPGMSAMYLAHASTRSLEDDFVVVHWDRRDAGKSFDAAMDPARETVSQQLRDAEALVMRLRARFGGRRVLLLGHSWGTYLGVLLAQRHPEWFAAYVGVGQVTNKHEERVVADRFVRAEAKRRGDSQALHDLATSPDATREQWLFAFGAELHGATSLWPIVAAGLLAPEYSFWDTLNVAKGPAYAQRHLKDDVLDRPLSEAVTALATPVFLLLGRHDYNTPSVLGAAYLERLSAPCKELVWFEHSAHFPFWEEAERFAAAMRRIRDMPCVAARLRDDTTQARRDP